MKPKLALSGPPGLGELLPLRARGVPGFFTRAYLLPLIGAAPAASPAATSGATSFLRGLPLRPVLGTTARAPAFAACHPSRLASSRAPLVRCTTWKGPMTRLALGHRLLTGSLIRLAPSAVTTSVPHLCLRVSPSRKGDGTSFPHPSWAQARHPRSWPTTTARYLWPLLWLVSSMPVRCRPSKRPEPRAASISPWTRPQMPPTLCHSTRAILDTADVQHLTARQATQSSRSRVKRDPRLAHGTRSTSTPCSGHLALAGRYSRWHTLLARPIALQRLAGSWSWHSHLRPQTGHRSRSLPWGLTPTTIAPPLMDTPRHHAHPKPLAIGELGHLDVDGQGADPMLRLASTRHG
nr:hypothetical protein [Olsenella sp. Marseille-P4559]